MFQIIPGFYNISSLQPGMSVVCSLNGSVLALAGVRKQICLVSVRTLTLYDEMVGIWRQAYPPC